VMVADGPSFNYRAPHKNAQGKIMKSGCSGLHPSFGICRKKKTCLFRVMPDGAGIVASTEIAGSTW
jgi:hypothetical protein